MTEKYTDDTFITFGKYDGRMLKNVPADYLIWYYEKKGIYAKNPALMQYIEENMEVLKKQLKR